jgi:hypothetical protein
MSGRLSNKSLGTPTGIPGGVPVPLGTDGNRNTVGFCPDKTAIAFSN